MREGGLIAVNSWYASRAGFAGNGLGATDEPFRRASPVFCCRNCRSVVSGSDASLFIIGLSFIIGWTAALSCGL